MTRIILTVAMLFVAATAAAHNLHQSSSEVTASGKTLTWVIAAHTNDIQHINKSLLTRRIVVENNGAACAMSDAHSAPSPHEAGHSLFTMRFDCAAPIGKLTLYYNLFFGRRDHVHSAHVQLPSGNYTLQFNPAHTSETVK